MNKEIKKNDKYLIDIDETYPLEVSVDDIWIKNTRNWFGKRIKVKMYYLTGEKYMGGLREIRYTIKFSEKELRQKIIKTLK